MSITVIINPVAGGASPERARERAELAASVLGDRSVEVFVTERAGHARELAAAAVRRGAQRVIAWGGDGTLNEVAAALAFTPVAFGIVPAGSGNGLARELGIPVSPRAALAIAVGDGARTIDMGEIEGRLFINIAGIGIDACVAARFNAAGNTRRGFVSYARITAAALVGYRPLDYMVETSHKRSVARALEIVLANSAQWGNGARIAPGAVLDDGLLDVVVITERSRLRTIANLRRLFDGTLADIPGCTVDRADRVLVECREPIAFHVDGEPVQGGTRLAARVHRRAITVIAPVSGRSTVTRA